MLPQISFFTQNLTVKKPETGERINQECPVRQNQELAGQDKDARHINRIAVLRKNAMQSHAAISSSQNSWCSPPRTSLILIRQAAGNSCRLSFGLANGFPQRSR